MTHHLSGPTTPEDPASAETQREAHRRFEIAAKPNPAVEPPGHSSPRGSRWYPRCKGCADEYGGSGNERALHSRR